MGDRDVMAGGGGYRLLTGQDRGLSIGDRLRQTFPKMKPKFSSVAKMNLPKYGNVMFNTYKEGVFDYNDRRMDYDQLIEALYPDMTREERIVMLAEHKPGN